MTFLNNEYREIITKAICGKGQKLSHEKKTISLTNQPSSILGCWIINHSYHAKKKSNQEIIVNGSYDVNIWYSFSDNTQTDVLTERIEYSDVIPLTIKDQQCVNDDYDIIANAEQQPNCLECEISKQGDKIAIEIERELLVQVIGETKLYVKVDPADQSVHQSDLDHALTDEEVKNLDASFLTENSK